MVLEYLHAKKLEFSAQFFATILACNPNIKLRNDYVMSNMLGSICVLSASGLAIEYDHSLFYCTLSILLTEFFVHQLNNHFV